MVTGPDSVEAPAVVIGAAVIGAEVETGSGGDGVDEDMIGPKSLDTKLVEPGVLPDLLRRL